MACNKTYNEFSRVISGTLYDACPKAVFAAIAVSQASCGGDRIEEAEPAIIREWWALHRAGIVPQRPPVPEPAEVRHGRK